MTNNFARSNVGIPQSELDFLGWSNGSTVKEVKELFDDYVDSSVVGLRYVETPISIISLVIEGSLKMGNGGCLNRY